MIRKRFHQNWMFECPDAVLACAILRCEKTPYFIFGGHDKTLYLVNQELVTLDGVQFDGWVRSMFPVDLDGDDCDEVLVGSGDGTCAVLKFDKVNKKFFAIMRYKPPRKVRIPEKINCCAAGDIFRNGTFGLIYGGEDKSLKIFKDVSATKPIDALHYDSWVNACVLGFLTVQPAKKPIYGMLVATKSGWLQFIQIIEDTPDILWQQHLNSSINTVRIGDVNNDGYNEIVVGCDDNYVKILDGQGKRLRYINTEGSRPLTVDIDDVDGDNAKEIVVGCADGGLRVYHNQTPNSFNFELKWKTKLSTSIEDICTLEDNDKIRQIIFGGYDRTLRSYTDFEWGLKKKVEVSIFRDFAEISAQDRVKATEKPKLEAIPTNIRGFIVKMFKEKGLYVSKDDLIKDLTNLAYPLKEINEELDQMIEEKSLQYKNLETPVWILSAEKAIVKLEEMAKPILMPTSEPPLESTIVIKAEMEVKPIISKTVAKVEPAPNVVPQVKAAPVVPKVEPAPKAAPQAKAAPVVPKVEPAPKAAPQVKAAPVVPKVEPAPKATPQVKAAPVAPKVEPAPNVGPQAKAAPVAPKVEPAPLPAVEVTPTPQKVEVNKSLKEIILDYLKETKLVATKPKFVSDILEKGFSKEEVETQINALKEEGAIVYSKIKPAGWSLAAEGGIKPTVEPKVGAPKVKAAPKAKAAPGKKAPKAKPAPKPKAAPESEQAKALETQTKIAEAGIKPAIELKVEVPKVKAAPKTKAVPGKKAPKAKPAPKPKAAPENEQATALETPSKIGKTAGEGASSRSKPPLKATIIEYLKGAKLVTTKPKFVADIVEKGYSKEEVEEQINSLKDEGLIAYSRTKPVGWSLSENSA